MPQWPRFLFGHVIPPSLRAAGLIGRRSFGFRPAGNVIPLGGCLFFNMSWIARESVMNRPGRWDPGFQAGIAGPALAAWVWFA